MYWEVIGNHMQRVLKKLLKFTPSPLISQTGVIISQFLCFGLLSPFLLLLELLIVLGGHRKPYSGYLKSQSDLPPGPPYGSNWDHKITDFLYFFISFIIAFRDLTSIGNRKPYTGSVESWSDLPLGT